MLPEFELRTPSTLEEAVEHLADAGPTARPIAGGTNLVVDMRSGRHCPPVLVDISRLAELRGVRREDGQLVVGGATTIAELLASPLLTGQAAVLAQACAAFANPLVRNRATVGGNLADASPAADTAPALLALGAVVELVSASGVRCLPLDEFFTGVRKTRLWPGEVLAALRWPAPAPRSVGGFRKVGLRKADAIAVLSAAVAVEWDRAGRCSQARIALGAVAPTPRRVPAAEDALAGAALTPAAIAEAVRLCMEAASPIDDVRGSAAYRRRVTGVVVRRLLEAAAQGAH